MAYFELNGNFARSARRRAKAGRPSFRGLLKRLIETPFDQRSAEIADQLDDLRSLSDAELEKRGLRREEIAFHLFGCREG